MNKYKIICFDADDTLWVNETYYLDIEKQFLDIMSRYTDRQTAADDLHKREIDNLEIYGYGAKGFMLSMLHTALEVTKGQVSAKEQLKIIELGRGLILQPMEIIDGVVETLEKLTDAGCKLIVATKGDLLDQERKLKRSGLTRFFDHIEIMSYKKEEDYRKLVNHLDVKPEEFLMVGNSMKSDILPVLEIGGSGIHVPFHTTWAHEVVDDVGERENLWIADSITEVIEILEV